MKLVLNKLIVLIGASVMSLGLTPGAFAEVLGGDYTSLLCPISLGIPERPYVDAELAEGDTFMTADEADLIEHGISTLTGSAEITRDIQQVTADKIIYNEPKDTADLTGDVNYWDADLFLNSNDAFLKFDNGLKS